MFKKLCLTLCLSAFLAWAQDDDEFDDSDFESAPAAASEEGGSGAAMASDDDSDFEDAEGPSLTAAQKQDMEARKKFEEEQRQDEYANSLRRRNWLKDRLVFQVGIDRKSVV